MCIFRNRNFLTGLFNWKNKMNLRLQLILVFIIAIVRGSRSHTREDYENVLYDIFTTRGYNKDVLPRLNSSEPVCLDVSLHFTKITAIDEKNEKMTSTGYLEIHWRIQAYDGTQKILEICNMSIFDRRKYGYQICF